MPEPVRLVGPERVAVGEDLVAAAYPLEPGDERAPGAGARWYGYEVRRPPPSSDARTRSSKQPPPARLSHRPGSIARTSPTTSSSWAARARRGAACSSRPTPAPRGD